MQAIPREASSIILLRDAPDSGELEVLMVRRNEESAFAGGMYVFPGGMVDEEDEDPAIARFCAGMEAQRATSILGDSLPPSKALAFFIAAVRELFEEVGILLAYEGSGEPWGKLIACGGLKGSRLAKMCENLREGRLSFSKMLEEESLYLALDQLVYFAHWITPEISPVRFDTRFFLAPAPAQQQPYHDQVETTGHLWISPDKAIKMCRDGSFPMLPPTVANLWELSRYPTTADALQAARKKNVTTILPRFDLT